MMRHCDATDPNLLDGPTLNSGPYACGLRFDDVERSVIYPHVFLPTAEDKARLSAWLDTVSVEELVSMTPGEAARRFAAVQG